MSMLFSDGQGPIPGENYTSDTKSYPWHQPPEYKSVSEALDKMSVKLTQPKTARYIMAFAQAGFPLVRISQMIIMEGMAQGKWTVDMGLLLAGPFTKIIEIMCDSYDIEYDIGIDEEDDYSTGNYYKAMTLLKKEANTVPGVSEAVEQQMPSIEAAAANQDQPKEDTGGADSGGASGAGKEEDLGMQGFTAMTSGNPKGPSKEGAPK